MPLAPSRQCRIHIPGRRMFVLAPLIALPVLVAADLGSVALVQVSVPDDAGEAARAGMTAIQFDRTTTSSTAATAYRAAADVASLHRLDLDEQTFTVFADGSVQLTARRNAPTLLFKRLPWLRDHTDVTATVTAHRSTW